MVLFLLQCPKCKHQMKYDSRDVILTAKRKKCVYCNHSYKVRDNILKKLA